MINEKRIWLELKMAYFRRTGQHLEAELISERLKALGRKK